MRRQVLERAFSLIETLVSIAIIIILLAVLLPTLSAAVESARRVRRLSSLQQTFQIIDLYAERSQDLYPYREPGLGHDLHPDPGSGGLIYTTIDPWPLELYWVGLIHDIAPWREFYALWVDEDHAGVGEPWDANPSPDEYRWMAPMIRYANSFVSSPATWGGPDAWVRVGPTVRSAVRYPSDKVLLFRDRAPNSTVRERAFVDGSANAATDDSAPQPVQNLLRLGVTPRVYSDTFAGVHGRDRSR